MVHQGGRLDPTESRAVTNRDNGAYQLSHVYDNSLLFMMTSCRHRMLVWQRQQLLPKVTKNLQVTAVILRNKLIKYTQERTGFSFPTSSQSRIWPDLHWQLSPKLEPDLNCYSHEFKKLNQLFTWEIIWYLEYIKSYQCKNWTSSYHNLLS